jgi:hypothetical protein
LNGRKVYKYVFLAFARSCLLPNRMECAAALSVACLSMLMMCRLFTPRFSFKGGKQDWFTYNGGLTTPGCFEIVCLLRLDNSIHLR